MRAAAATLTDLYTYPVKSCRGIRRDRARLEPTGLADDRHWMLVRPNGRFITQRELPRMALILTSLDAEALTLTAPDRAPLSVPRDANVATMQVTVWGFDGRGIDCGPVAAEWVSDFLETPLRLVRFDPDAPRVCSPEWTPGATAVTEFSDGFPMLIISRASLAELNMRLPNALPMERFRPNLVIDGVDAYDEDRIHELRADGVTIRLVKPCARCAITTTDQQTGERDGVEPLQTLREFRFDRKLRGVLFGQNAIPVAGAGSDLRVGQQFEIVWR
ncbi:MAG TPA: MOSC N-terminal beta barrel domain-containing protein [Steroidobacteraceae bacterium]|nr:MOSC N-terminal beta barrel domain-containing protein [Steroidobacteraceae bacterium]